MDPFVFLAVMAAAALHASWNALIKGGQDPYLSMTYMATRSGTLALLLLPFVQMPVPQAWVWLAASAALHTAYRYFLIEAYKAGDLVQVYPIARGAAPLMTAASTALLIGETLSPFGYAGIGALVVGVFLMSLRGGRLGHLEPRAVGYALMTSLTITAYTFVDGVGARINGSPQSFWAWMTCFNGLTMVATAMLWRGPAVLSGFRKAWVPAVGGSVMSMAAYGIAIWAMTKAPIALVAALRETSVLFAALISVLILKEPMTRWRTLAAAGIVGGIVLLRLA